MTSGRICTIKPAKSIFYLRISSYTGRNPKTGNEIEVRPKSSTYFKVGKELRERIHGKGISG
jgi:integration host factor subunit beta